MSGGAGRSAAWPPAGATPSAAGAGEEGVVVAVVKVQSSAGAALACAWRSCRRPLYQLRQGGPQRHVSVRLSPGQGLQ